MFDQFANFIQANKLYFDAAGALSSVLNLFAWLFGLTFLVIAWRRGRVRSVGLGPLSIQMKEEAVETTAAAVRAWRTDTPAKTVDVGKIRSTIERAFAPDIADSMIGKAVLWVDDNPDNNMLAVRALKKLRLEVEQVTSTDAALAALDRRPFDLIISDMGRGEDMRAGYDLLKRVRDRGNKVPFAVFAGSDKPEFRKEAAERGAQLSTNDMIELIDFVVTELGEKR